MPFVSTTSNMADFFTKPLAGEAFFRLRNVIMNLPPRSGSAARSRGVQAREARPRDSGCAHAPESGSDTSPVAQSTGLPPSPKHVRFTCCACGGVGLVKGEPCYVCGGCGYHVGRSPAVPSAGGCREPLCPSGPRPVAASLE